MNEKQSRINGMTTEFLANFYANRIVECEQAIEKYENEVQKAIEIEPRSLNVKYFQSKVQFWNSLLTKTQKQLSEVQS
jgi:hypothetical protein